jgi:uncharacterized membrane protein YeiH
MPGQPIQLPLAFDLTATFVSALAGALVAVRRRYDFVGVFALAFATGVGGALIRDGVFLQAAIQAGPPAVVRDSGYLLAVLAATLLGVGVNQLGPRVERVYLLLDAIGLGVYAVVGADRSLVAGLGHLGAVLVGVTNAVGGGVIRDVLTREEPLLFKPGQFYAMAALAAAILYVGLRAGAELAPIPAAATAATAGVVLRLLAIRYNWTTRPLYVGYRAENERRVGPGA